MVDVQVSSGGTTDTSNKNTDFFAALASTSEQVEKMESTLNNSTNAMSVADYKKEKQVNNSQVFVDDTWTPVENLIPADFMTAITPLLKYLEKQGKIQILDDSYTIEEDNTEIDNNTSDDIVDVTLKAVIGTDEDIQNVLESIQYDEDKFLDTYYANIYAYLNLVGYTDNDIDNIMESILDEVFK